ncbi:MAG: hypothetical protein K6A28_07455 [Bacteroidales bacterium]|nr:hypothetical protein [Bacteroidales bacterium]
MKKSLVLMMCCLVLAFASCNSDKEQEAVNKKFIGSFAGTIYLNGTANAPQLAEFGMTQGLPLENMGFDLIADITAGSNDETVNVLFTIPGEPEDQSYQTTGTCNGNTISFGDLTYHYVEDISTLDVILTLTGELNGETMTLTGPATGNGSVMLEGFPILLDLNVTADVTGSIVKRQNVQ